MATVPVYGNRRVQTAPLPSQQVNPNAPAAAFGVQAPNPLTGAVQAFEPIVAEETARTDRVAVTDAENHLHQLEIDLTREAEQKYRGKDAMGATAFVEQERAKRLSEIDARLNGRQRDVFRQRADQRLQSLRTRLAHYEDQEFKRYKIDTYAASMQNDIDSAIADPTRAEQFKREGVAKLTAFAREEGWGDEQTTKARGEFTSKLHSGVIDRMLSEGNDRAAEQYAAQHKDELVGDDRLRVEKALEVGTRLGKAQRNADQILANRGVTKTQAYEQAKLIEDPQERQDTERELDTQFRRMAEAERADYEAVSEQAFSAAVNTGRVPPNLLSRLKAKDQLEVRNFLRKQAEGQPIETDWNTYYQLKTLAATDPTKFRRENLLGYRARLGETEFKELVKEQTGLRGGSGESENLRGFRTVREVVADFLPADMKENSDEGRAYLRAVDVEVAGWRTANGGKQPPMAEVRNIAAQVARRTITTNRSRLIPGVTKRSVFTLSSEEAEAKPVPFFQIPEQDRQMLQRYFHSNGRAPTIDLIQRAYMAYLRGDSQRLTEIVTGDN